MNNGFVTLNRSILQWRWFTSPATAHLFVFLIVRANHADGDFMGTTVRRGQLLTSLGHLSRDTGLTVKQVRTALKHLKETGEVAEQVTTRNRLITIVNYDLYQTVGAKQRADKGQSKGKARANKGQLTTISNNDNPENNKYVCATHIPSPADAEEFFRSRGRSPEDAGKFYSYNNARGWKIGRTPIEDWQSAAEMWIAQGDDPGGRVNNDDQLDDFGRPIRKEI